MKKKLAQPEVIARKALRLMDKIEAMKPAYAKLDELVLQLSCFRGSIFKVGRRALTIEDKFAKKNTAWKSTPFRRFELCEVSSETKKKAKRLARKARVKTVAKPRKGHK